MTTRTKRRPAVLQSTPAPTFLGLPSYDEWSLRAACRDKIEKDEEDDDQWHPESAKNTWSGKQICNGPDLKELPQLACPVRGVCLAWALENKIKWGTWGGMDQWEREAHRKRYQLS